MQPHIIVPRFKDLKQGQHKILNAYVNFEGGQFQSMLADLTFIQYLMCERQFYHPDFNFNVKSGKHKAVWSVTEH